MGDLDNMAADHLVQVDFNLSGEPYLIRGNASRLYRSVYTLLEAAIHNSPEGSQVAVALVFTESEIFIQVSDAGPSIPEDELPHIFEKYSRGASGQTAVELGLAMVWATVEAHRGSISVRNAEEQGTDFIVTLPANLRVG